MWTRERERTDRDQDRQASRVRRADESADAQHRRSPPPAEEGDRQADRDEERQVDEQLERGTEQHDQQDREAPDEAASARSTTNVAHDEQRQERNGKHEREVQMLRQQVPEHVRGEAEQEA